MNFFVTGGAGFIGSHFIRLLLSKPDDSVGKVTVYDKFTYSGNPNNLTEFNNDPRFQVIQGDICDEGMVDQALGGHDIVIHFAAESHVDRSISTSRPFFYTNVLGTQTLLEVSRKHQVTTFVHVSTDEVYGSIDEGSWTEDWPLLPNSPYSASKASSDLAARAFHQTYGMDIRTTRCSNNFGTHQYPEKLIPLFITNLIDGEKVPLYGDGKNVRDWLHVEDHCQGILLVAEHGSPGEIYNIGGGTELSNLEITRLILHAFDKSEDWIESVRDRLGHDRRYSVDWTKINRELGYRPQHSLEDSLQTTISWYVENEKWWRPLKHK